MNRREFIKASIMASTLPMSLVNATPKSTYWAKEFKRKAAKIPRLYWGWIECLEELDDFHKCLLMDIPVDCFFYLNRIYPVQITRFLAHWEFWFDYGPGYEGIPAHVNIKKLLKREMEHVLRRKYAVEITPIIDYLETPKIKRYSLRPDLAGGYVVHSHTKDGKYINIYHCGQRVGKTNNSVGAR